jgi:hypothetical protein
VAAKQETTMPEGPEVETEKLHETIQEEFEREGGAFLKQISITTAMLAILAAVASLQAGTTVNTALMLKTDATRLQSEASDLWAYYQAKGIKAAVQEASLSPWLALGKEPPTPYQEKIHRYEGEQKEIQDKAREKERERDEKLKESDHYLHRHHGFANAVVLFQVSIALGAVAALTRSRQVWFGSLLSGAAGMLFFGWTMLH